MYGFEAISAHNGWGMALAGALIVFSGLVILSTVISQLHKVLGFFDGGIKRKKNNRATHAEPEASGGPPKQDTEYRFLDNVIQVIDDYKAASEALGEPFSLTELHRLAGEMDAPHPHLTISYLRQHQYLVPTGDGLFSWR